ncbi:MAG: bifunctional folylpolyglutamate synthase/dihydrofolate synthase [Muribaculaceae bacterium]|nr:bifunctional folylpolyglutamate synthase/dihydrofolate synthase [Muribaculaceae bacterium]
MQSQNIETRYQEALDWLFSQIPAFHREGAGAYKPGLETISTLCRALGNPQMQYKTVHVGGTNGKGSVSSLIASVLTEAGHTVGLFTSPHLVDFRERIRVNGEMITREGVLDFLDRYKALNLDIEPSFFELTTAMAFDWFARRGVDWAVIEVGLGGRLDSTNIIVPQLSVITNISLDHTSLLGDTPELIAAEKAGIIKENVPVVIGRAEGEVMRVFNRAASERFALARFAHMIPAYTEAVNCGTHILYKGTPWGDISCPLTGDCQPENANTVLYALAFLPGMTREAVTRGFTRVLENSGLAGRWMTVSTSPLTVCDTAHNPGGWEILGPQLERLARERPLHIVIGFVADKDLSTITGYLPRGASYYFTQPSTPRARDAEDTARVCRDAGLEGGVYASVKEALRAARKSAGDAGAVFVGGSTFVVADFLELFSA